MEYDIYGRPIMKHIPYENGGGTGKRKDCSYEWLANAAKIMDNASCPPPDYIYISEDDYKTLTERPEDPIDEVIEITEEAWENNDLYISGDRRGNG